MSLTLSSGVQEALVAILLFDPIGAKIAAGLIPPASYDAHFKDLAKEAMEYLEKYGQPAGEHALDLVETLKSRRKDSAAIYQRIYESLLATKDSINREYIFAQAGKFAKGQRIRDGLSKAMDALERDDSQGVDEAEDSLRKALEGSWETFDPGGRFDDPARSLRFLTSPRVAFPTGIPALDRYGLGPARKELHILAAGTGVGKSWWLVHLAKMALLAHHKVLYITLELSESEIMQRLVMSFFAYSKRKGIVTRRRIKKDLKGRVKSIEEQVLEDRPWLFDRGGLPRLGVEDELGKRLTIFKKRAPIYVREFTAGSLTVRGVRSYLANLEASAHFMPDLILFDYPDEMEHDPKFKRLELIKIFTDLRGVGQEHNAAMATVTQLSDEGDRKALATKHDLGEAKAKAQKADVLLTISQTQAEFERGLARMFVAKGRADKDRFTILLSQCFELGQFVVDSARMSGAYAALMREQDAKQEKSKEDA